MVKEKYDKQEKKNMNKKGFDKQYKYQLIAEDIKLDIFSNRLKANTPLPSIRAYTEKYGVASNTIVSALHLLRDKGIIYSHRTKGYCVAGNIDERKVILANELIDNLIADMKHIGFSQYDLLQLIRRIMKL